MIKVKNVLLTALVATFMVGGIASVEEASVNANAQTVHVHHAKKHAKKHSKKHAKKHTKKHSKKRVVKKHVKKSAKKHVRKVAKKRVAKKVVRKAAKKHVAKKVVSKKITNRMAADTDNNPTNPLARNNKRVALPQDTDFVGYVYTYGRGYNSAKNIGRVAPYLKLKAVREDGMSDAQWAKAQRDVYMSNELDKEAAQQGNFPLFGGDYQEKANTNGSRIDLNAYRAAVQKYGWKLTTNEWGI
ncbi:hypothetical protein FD690_02255 [Apilactobacillus kunkeei]|uniref:hypothetical protein n=1 Tax=Apilactobacillus kunkeei TaxID=148814 RepID=UPI00110D23BB|nr:hypothetical protein [Apilactobacillus kunkeei]TMT02163.1 hypothetical protein FD690_02255 [Apilactobacillus kunkeei]